MRYRRERHILCDEAGPYGVSRGCTIIGPKVECYHPKKVNHNKPNQNRTPNNEISKKIKKRISHDYQPSNIWATRDSSFWQWQRVKEWFRDYAQYNDSEKIQQHNLCVNKAMSEAQLD